VYGFSWYFYQDGTIQHEVKLTGLMIAGALEEGEQPRYGTVVAPRLQAVNHQHFFNYRLDFDVDGTRNQIYEVHSEPAPPGPDNPYHNAFVARRTLLSTEHQAQQLVDPFSARCWDIVNPNVLNGLGQPVAYRLSPGENVIPMARPEASVIKRAGFITKHLWVTPYAPDERYAGGDYPHMHPGGAGLPAYTEGNRSLEDADLVLWYTFGSHHIPRPEDWPVMPTVYTGFMLKPNGFFDRNPALDVPPSTSQSHCRHE
jgi:primary-amine oxidase